ncbi:FAD-dependent oxidoreductase [Rubritepida flocculans]|uniref:FAD-dependent oxidoreductase n=1 Tax=Rubritepida flocculans TaxID=182403 RepID=UPI000423FE4D|nr:FAD-dependent oxidoreductase [Rubritepida flocculans]
MAARFAPPRYASPPPRHPGGEEAARLVVAGGGLVGLTVALDLARRGVDVVLLDEDDTVSTGSRAICFAKRTLEIYGRLGLGARFLEKGVTWNRGRVFHGEREAYAFDLLPEQGHEYPAFVNLQQYYAEAWLVEACAATGRVDLRWRHKVTGIENRPDGARLAVETPQGAYTLHAEWLLACDGARSFLRESLGLPFVGQVFRDRFLIADVVMQADFPTERWFWFDPPFHPGQSVLLHKQPDDVSRIDFQLGWEADPEAEKDPARVRARVAAMLGPKIPFELEWVSVYTFRCRRMERFRHGRTLFLGDAAHQVSPFGARGGNGGVQDADNLAWRLAAVLTGEAGEALLEGYEAERIPAADENILNSTRSTDFITPKNPAARAWREAVLQLARRHAFARPLVNSGRLSRPWSGQVAAPDAPVLREGQAEWLLRHIGHDGRFTLIAREATPPALPGVTALMLADTPRPGTLHDHSGLAAARLGLAPGEAALFRPDQILAGRAPAADRAALAALHAKALAR